SVVRRELRKPWLTPHALRLTTERSNYASHSSGESRGGGAAPVAAVAVRGAAGGGRDGAGWAGSGPARPAASPGRRAAGPRPAGDRRLPGRRDDQPGGA